jgi:hypothetical protein
MSDRVKLTDHAQVMRAFLAGHRLVHKDYGYEDGDDNWLYLSEQGFICEEDGAGAKSHRVPLCWRSEDPCWEILK